LVDPAELFHIIYTRDFVAICYYYYYYIIEVLDAHFGQDVALVIITQLWLA
jgi:hypothetical protein